MSDASPDATPGRTPDQSTDSKHSHAPDQRPAGDASGGDGASKAPCHKWQAGTVVDRRAIVDRRTFRDPRTGELVYADEAEGDSGLERRRGRGRRLSDFSRSAEEGEMTTEQFLFLMAIDEFKKANHRTFPQWTDVLEVIRLLGYRKTMPSELTLQRAEDWREMPDAPANVRPRNWDKRAA
jgi:hypothetical protein